MYAQVEKSKENKSLFDFCRASFADFGMTRIPRRTLIEINNEKIFQVFTLKFEQNLRWIFFDFFCNFQNRFIFHKLEIFRLRIGDFPAYATKWRIRCHVDLILVAKVQELLLWKKRMTLDLIHLWPVFAHFQNLGNLR